MSIRESAVGKIAEVLGQPEGSIADDAVLTTLVNSSFVLVELVIELQEEFGVRFHQADMNGIATVGQLLDLVESRVGT